MTGTDSYNTYALLRRNLARKARTDRITTNPSIDPAAAQQAAGELMHILELDLPEIPFSLLDNIEYWLFEKAYQCRARERGVKKSSRKLKSASHQCNLAAL